MSSTQLTVSCHCGASTHTFTVPTSPLPFQPHLCNCNISRRISGTLLTSYVTIPKTLSPENSSDVINNPKPDLSTLTPYHSSEILTRHFCTTCGTHMYLEYHSDGHFEVATGTLCVKSSENLIEFQDLMWIGATRDGGASNWITHIRSRELPRYLEESGTSKAVPLDWHADNDEASTPDENSRERKAIHAHCHCNGVQFWIAPPHLATRHILDTPYPDLLTPYHRTSLFRRCNDENRPWWLPERCGNTPCQDRDIHYLAGLCTCTSCRKMSGFDITAWAFVPSTSIFLDEACTVPFPFPTEPTPPTSNSNPLEELRTTLRAYKSSEDVIRSFCSTCGANAFWDGRADSGQERVIDVAVGLLNAPSGARAEEILSWCAERVSFREEAANKALVAGLEDGLRTWAEERFQKSMKA